MEESFCASWSISVNIRWSLQGKEAPGSTFIVVGLALKVAAVMVGD